MTIHFQLNRDDVRQLNREHENYVARRCADHTASKVYWYLLLPASIAGVAVVSESFPVAIFAFGLIWGANSLGNRWYRARYIKNFYSDDNLATSLLPFQLELLPDRLILSNANFIHHHFWHAFRFLRETSNYFHLFFSPVSSMGFPKSAFSSDTDLEAFRKEVKSHEPANA